MIGQNESNPYAAEVPFFWPTRANPLVGLTGHTFTLGEVKYRLPGAGAWTSAAVVKIVEKGFGRYAVQLAAGETATLGTVGIQAIDLGSLAQPYVGTENITQLGGDIAVGTDGYVPFYLPQSADPIYGAPITGHSFVSGEVKIALPNAAYTNATTTDIVEYGFGWYGLLLRSSLAATALNGKAYLYANVSGAQPYEGFVTILGAGAVPAPVPSPPAPLVLPTAALTGYTISAYDHVGGAILRLCEYSRFTK